MHSTDGQRMGCTVRSVPHINHLREIPISSADISGPKGQLIFHLRDDGRIDRWTGQTDKEPVNDGNTTQRASCKTHAGQR